MSDARERTDGTLVASAMDVLGNAPLNAPRVADAETLWWRARLMQRVEAERRAGEPAEFGAAFAGVALGLASFGVGVAHWSALAAAGSPIVAGLLMVSLVGLASLAARAAWTLRPR